MAVAAGDNTAGSTANSATADSAEIRVWLDQLGSTQHLDRERSRLKLRASLHRKGNQQSCIVLTASSRFSQPNSAEHADTAPATLNELQKRVSEQPGASADWHQRLAWLNIAEVRAYSSTLYIRLLRIAWAKSMWLSTIS